MKDLTIGSVSLITWAILIYCLEQYGVIDWPVTVGEWALAVSLGIVTAYVFRYSTRKMEIATKTKRGGK